MTKLVWDADTTRLYETGTKAGVLYTKKSDGTYDKGVAWNGLTAVSESPSGAEETALYADDFKYLSLRSAEEFGATVEAYTYPDEWAACDGSASIAAGVYVGQQTRKGFGMSYRTTIGNDTEGNDYGEKIHLIYNAMASPSERSYATINDSPEAITFSWTLTTTPIDMPKVDGVQLKKSATIVIDTTKISKEALEAIENALYGSETSEPRLLMPEELIEIIDANPLSGQPSETPAVETTYDEVDSTAEGYNQKNPSSEGWYEADAQVSGGYKLTEDTEVQTGKTYYTVHQG